MSSPGHAIRRVAYDGWAAEIDCGIADLVLELWRAGIGTFYSCEDRGGRAWLRMSRPSASRLIALVGSDLLTLEPAGGFQDVTFELAHAPKLIDRLHWLTC
jgi:hypothetical protein